MIETTSNFLNFRISNLPVSFVLSSEVVLDLYRAMAINPKCQKLWDALLTALEEIFEQEEGSILDTAVVTACNIGK